MDKLTIAFQLQKHLSLDTAALMCYQLEITPFGRNCLVELPEGLYLNTLARHGPPVHLASQRHQSVQAAEARLPLPQLHEMSAAMSECEQVATVTITQVHWSQEYNTMVRQDRPNRTVTLLALSLDLPSWR